MQGRVCFRKAAERLKKLRAVEWLRTMFCVVGLSKYWENDYTIARIAELLNVSVSTFTGRIYKGPREYRG